MVTATDYPFANLGTHSRKVTSSREAQTWFDRGLNWLYGFNHDEAIYCFKRAIGSDSNCVLAYFGAAAASGPHYNNPEVDYPDLAKDMIEKGEHTMSSSSTTPAAEVALLRAMRVRHIPSKEGQTREEMDLAYAAEMEKVYLEHGRAQKDADVLAFYIEALMQLSPWRLWKSGKMNDQTRIADIVALLDEGLAFAPNHPALLHFHIHAWEMAPNPEIALPTANRLRQCVPDAGHLVHMPSHIDMLVGDYAKAISANERAVEVDRAFLKHHGPEGFYTLYRFHDLHLLVYAAMFAGCYEKAINAALELAATPENVIAERADWLEAFMAVSYHVWLRFGKWTTVLEQEPRKDVEVFCVTEATRLFARAVALAALERPEEAEKERLLFEEARAKVPASRTLFNNTAEAMLTISAALALGEVRYRQGLYDEAFSSLRAAAKEADDLIYDEPEGQMMPIRHALGALLLEQGHLEEAEQVLREDLAKHPKNIWALRGIDEILARTGRGTSDEAKEVKMELAKLEKIADMPIGATCFCRLTRF